MRVSSKNISRLVFLLLPLFFGSNLNAFDSERFNEYAVAIPGLTHIESWSLLDGSWYGPLLVKNESDEVMEIEGYLSNCDCLVVVQMTEAIQPGEQGLIEVIFSPDSLGLYTARLTLTTNVGERQTTLRANVVADNPYMELGLKWRNTKPYDDLLNRYLYPANELVEDLKENPDDWLRMLIDPRPSGAFQEGHALGAINLQLHELMYRNELKNRRIFIIDSGDLNISIFNEIRRLEAAGFEQIFWVEGGLSQWQLVGGEMAGQSSTVEAWRSLNPSRLFNSLLRDKFIILNCGSDEVTEKIEGIFIGQPVLVWSDLVDHEAANKTDDTNFQKLRSSLFAKGAKSRPILLITDKGGSLVQVIESLKKENFTWVYELQAGLAPLERYLKAVNLPKEEKLFIVKAGATNPKGKIAPKKLTDNDCTDCP